MLTQIPVPSYRRKWQRKECTLRCAASVVCFAPVYRYLYLSMPWSLDILENIYITYAAADRCQVRLNFGFRSLLFGGFSLLESACSVSLYCCYIACDTACGTAQRNANCRVSKTRAEILRRDYGTNKTYTGSHCSCRGCGRCVRHRSV